MTETPTPPPQNPRFRYRDNAGEKAQVGLPTLRRMAIVRAANQSRPPTGPVRRGTTSWSGSHIRDAAKAGLWIVQWEDSADLGSWAIVRLTPLGNRVLDRYIELYGEP